MNNKYTQPIVTNGNAVDALINGEIDYLLHCCNCQSTFGSGIAKEIKEKLPAAYASDVNCKLIPSKRLGHYSIGDDVINLYGQYNFGNGKQIDYGAYALALSRALLDLKADIEEDGTDVRHVTLGFPYKIGSDRAGGDWNTVKEITEGVVSSLGYRMVWYKL